MPTILREGAFSVRIYVDDHQPAHVHVVSGTGTAKIRIDGEGRPRVISVVGMNKAEAMRAFRLVAHHREFCLRRWEEIHG